MSVSIEWLNLYLKLRVGDCFEIHILHWESWHQSFMLQMHRKCVVRMIPLVYTSQLRSCEKWVKIMCIWSETSHVIHVKCLWTHSPHTDTYRFSVNVCNHSDRSRNRSEVSGTMSIFLFLLSIIHDFLVMDYWYFRRRNVADLDEESSVLFCWNKVREVVAVELTDQSMILDNFAFASYLPSNSKKMCFWPLIHSKDYPSSSSRIPNLRTVDASFRICA